MRYAFPGDWATVESDGMLVFLGRGSNCINTGGEKVFPEEVEDALKTHPAVTDALVFGAPDERLGERIEAVVSANRRAHVPEPRELIDHVRDRLASYKAPRRVVVIEQVPRFDNGKPDYAAAKQLSADNPTERVSTRGPRGVRGWCEAAPFWIDRWRGDGAKMARESSASFRRRVVMGSRPSISTSGLTCGFMSLATLDDPIEEAPTGPRFSFTRQSSGHGASNAMIVREARVHLERFLVEGD